MVQRTPDGTDSRAGITIATTTETLRSNLSSSPKHPYFEFLTGDKSDGHAEYRARILQSQKCEPIFNHRGNPAVHGGRESGTLSRGAVQPPPIAVSVVVEPKR